MTFERDVVTTKAKLAVLKAEFMDSLNAYMAVPSKTDLAAKSAVLEAQKKGTAYFNYAEEFVGNSDLLGAHKSDLWAQGFAEDCAEILASMLDYYKFLAKAFQQVPELRGLRTTPGQTAFANMQRMVVEYLNGKLAKDMRQKFFAAGLPVYGFDNQVTPKSSTKLNTVLSYIFGAVMVLVVLSIALAVPDPSPFQRRVFWAILAMALAGVASVIPGFIEVNLRKWVGVVAGGALAVFVIVYFFAPVDPDQASGNSVSAPITDQAKRPAVKSN